MRAEMNFTDEAEKELRMLDAAEKMPLKALPLSGTSPTIPRPHTIYAGEDILVEEFLPTTRFSDLPRHSPIGASQAKIAKKVVRWGLFDLVYREWLEPDPHTGNRQAGRRWRDLLRAKLVIMDLGQGHDSSIDLLKPLMKAALALEAGDHELAARRLSSITRIPEKKTEADVVAEIKLSLMQEPNGGIVERLMESLIKSEEMGAMIRPEYASLQKAFLIYAGYSPWLPKNYLFTALERATMASLLRDRPKPLWDLAKFYLKGLFKGRPAVRAEFEELIDGMKSRLVATPNKKRPQLGGFDRGSPDSL